MGFIVIGKGVFAKAIESVQAGTPHAPDRIPVVGVSTGEGFRVVVVGKDVVEDGGKGFVGEAYIAVETGMAGWKSCWLVGV